MSYRINGNLPAATGSGVDGYANSVSGQAATGLNGHGGHLILAGGSGSADGYDGYVIIETGTRIVFVADGYNLAAFTGANPSANEASFGGGKSVIFIGNTTVAPTTDPTSGGILYVEGGALKYRSPNGVITTIAPA